VDHRTRLYEYDDLYRSKRKTKGWSQKAVKKPGKNIHPIQQERKQVIALIDQLAQSSQHATDLTRMRSDLATIPTPYRRDNMAFAIELDDPRNEESRDGLLYWNGNVSKIL